MLVMNIALAQISEVCILTTNVQAYLINEPLRNNGMSGRPLLDSWLFRIWLVFGSHLM